MSVNFQQSCKKNFYSDGGKYYLVSFIFSQPNKTDLEKGCFRRELSNRAQDLIEMFMIVALPLWISLPNEFLNSWDFTHYTKSFPRRMNTELPWRQHKESGCYRNLLTNLMVQWEKVREKVKWQCNPWGRSYGTLNQDGLWNIKQYMTYRPEFFLSSGVLVSRFPPF